MPQQLHVYTLFHMFYHQINMLKILDGRTRKEVKQRTKVQFICIYAVRVAMAGMPE